MSKTSYYIQTIDPSAPATGYITIYNKGGTLYAIDEHGTVTATTINDNVVAMVSGTQFTGNIQAPIVSASLGFSGSLTNLIDGTSYLVAGTNITIVSESNGQVIVSSTGGSCDGADPGVSFITVANTASLANERALVGGTGIDLVDGGANTGITASIDDDVVATVSGTQFTGNIQAPIISASLGFSGSLTTLVDGTPYLRQLGGISITTESNGSIIISGSVDTGGSGGGSGADPGVSFITVANTASLANERALVGGTGISLVDGGANTGITASIDDNVVATVSGTQFTGNIQAPIITASLGFSGSLTTLLDGTPYLRQLGGISITTESNGSIIISGSVDTGGAGGSGDGADPGVSFITVANTASLSNERALVGGTGINLVDGGANTGLTASIDDNTVAMVSGTQFSGNIQAPIITASLGFSGSLTRLIDGTSYLVGSTGINVVSESNSQITLSVDDNTVAMVSGTQFSGNIQAPIITASLGFSGSLTALIDGTPYLIGSTGITISSESNGQVTVSETTAGGPSAWISGSANLRVASFLRNDDVVKTYTNSGSLVVSASNYTFDKCLMLVIASTTASSGVDLCSDFRIIGGGSYTATSGTVNIYTCYVRDESSPIIDVTITQEE